jgi:hypothetical protein
VHDTLRPAFLSLQKTEKCNIKNALAKAGRGRAIRATHEKRINLSQNMKQTNSDTPMVKIGVKKPQHE